jgi:putative acetyltransferase
MAAFIVREAKPDDAAQIIAHVRQVADEPNNGIAMSSASEFKYTEEEERAIIQEVAEADDKLMIVAEADDQIIGVANCRAGRGGYHHTFSLGITVHLDWRNQGVGRAMMQHMIAWCNHNPLAHRLELWVFPENLRAIRLYEHMGFQHEGNRRASFLKEGEFRDLLLMGMVLE